MNSKLTLLKKIVIPNKHLIIASLAIQACIAFIGAIYPYLTKLRLDQLQKSHTSIGPIDGLSPFVIFSLILLSSTAIEIVRLTIFDHLSLIFNSRLSSNSRLQYAHIFWKKLSEIDVGFFENFANHRIISLASRSYDLVKDVLSISQGITRSVVIFITAIPVLALIDWRLIVISIITALLQAFFARAQIAHSTLGNLELDKSRQDFSKVDRLLTSDLPDIRIMGATDELKMQYLRAVNHLDRLTLKLDVSSDKFRTLQRLISEAASLSINIIVGFWALGGAFSIGTFTLIVSYSLQLNGVFRDVLNSVTNWQELDIKLDQLQFFFDIKPRLKSLPTPITNLSAPSSININSVSTYYPDYSDEEKSFVEALIKKMKKLTGIYKKTYFKYDIQDFQELISKPATTKNIIEDVSMKIERGKLTALIGSNGSGKTTLTRLIMHSLETVKGDITMSGNPIWKYDPDVYLQQFALVQQRPFLLNNFSIRDNLTLGMSNKPSDSQIWEVLSEVDLKIPIEKSPTLLDTLLGDGFELSGGQRQLLVIARVLLQNHPFIIMDESTSQLDAEHEAKVLKLLKTKLKKSAILFITHRLSTARRADVIYVLENGTITQTGIHSELIKTPGLYSRYWHLQTQDI